MELEEGVVQAVRRQALGYLCDDDHTDWRSKSAYLAECRKIRDVWPGGTHHYVEPAAVLEQAEWIWLKFGPESDDSTYGPLEPEPTPAVPEIAPLYEGSGPLTLEDCRPQERIGSTDGWYADTAAGWASRGRFVPLMTKADYVVLPTPRAQPIKVYSYEQTTTFGEGDAKLMDRLTDKAELMTPEQYEARNAGPEVNVRKSAVDPNNTAVHASGHQKVDGQLLSGLLRDHPKFTGRKPWGDDANRYVIAAPNDEVCEWLIGLGCRIK
jgi:hypothetical protein